MSTLREKIHDNRFLMVDRNLTPGGLFGGVAWRCTPRQLAGRLPDFVVLCRSREDAEQAKDVLTKWLAERGLKLSEEKTRIAHITEGFDFLSYNVRHYKVRRTRIGYKLLIKPSKDAVRRIRG